MAVSCQTGVEAGLPHFVRLSHEEVDDSVSYHAVGKSLNGMVVAISEMQTVALFVPFFHWNGVTKGGSVARHLSHRTTDLKAKNMLCQPPWLTAPSCLMSSSTSHQHHKEDTQKRQKVWASGVVSDFTGKCYLTRNVLQNCTCEETLRIVFTV